MASFMIMLVWMALGVVVSMFWRLPDEPRFAWAPIAIILGPIWALIAYERQEGPQALLSPVKTPVEVARPPQQDFVVRA